MYCIFIGMKKNKHNRWIDAIWTTALSVAIGVSFYFLFGRIVFETFLSQLSETDVLASYYAVENHSSDIMGSDEQVVLFNTDGEKSRAAIAEAIGKIGDCAPLAIGVDIIFSEASGVGAKEDSLLEHTLSSQVNLVMAARVVGDSVEHSFFTLRNGLQYGAVNMDNLCNYVPSYKVNGTEIPSFSSAVSGVNLNKKRVAVNYSNKMFNIVNISEEIVPEDFNDKFVLVGDLGDLRDTHDLSFPVCGSRRVAGTTLTAYAVSSLLNREWIVKTPDWINVSIGLLITYFATVLCYRIKGKYGFGDFAERVIQIIQFIVLLFLGYLVFTCFGVSVNILYAAVGIALMGLSIDLLDAIQRKSVKKNDKR